MLFEYLSPWGLSNIIASITHYGGSIDNISVVLLAIEAILVAFRKYPKLPRNFYYQIDPQMRYVVALLFYLGINLFSNFVIFLWAMRDLSV